MNRERDKNVIQVFLDCYNALGGTDYSVNSYPDEKSRNSKEVDALCIDSSIRILALEHTRIEAFPGEMNDGFRFLEVMGQLERDPTLTEAGFQTCACIPVDSIPTRIKWETLGKDIGAFLRGRFPLREGTYIFSQTKVSLPISITKLPVPGLPGSFLVERTWPGKSNDPTIEKCLADKLPKLEGAVADVKVLLLEQPGIAGSVSQDLINYGQERGRPSWLPNEIWLMRTAALENEQYVHVSELHPVVNYRMAAWKDGEVTTRPLQASA